MPEDKLWTRTYSTRDQVPVFTRAKIKSRFGILKILPSHYANEHPMNIMNVSYIRIFVESYYGYITV